MMDDNIDTSPDAKHNKIYKISEMLKMLNDHITSNNLCCHNKKITRFVRHQPPSCIDHVHSNCPYKIFNIDTIRTTFSDHAMIICNYKMNKRLYNPKFVNTNNRKNLSRHNLL